MEGVGRSGDVFQVERRPDEGEPVGERFQGVHRLVDPVGVFGGRSVDSESCQGRSPKAALTADPRAPAAGISTLHTRARSVGVSRKASVTACMVKAVLPAPGAPPNSVTSPGPISSRASSPEPTG